MNTHSGDRANTEDSMTGRERMLRALAYKKVDRVPVDLGGTPCSGAHVSVVAKLRQALGLDKSVHPAPIRREPMLNRCWMRELIINP